MRRSWRTPNATSRATLVLQPQDLASKQTVDTQRATVDQLAAQLQVDQAVIDNARTQLDYTRITSPINGRTGIRLVDPGNIVHAAATTGIVVVTQVQPIAVIFTLPEEDLADRQCGAVARGPVKVTTVSRDGGTELDEGTLTLIDNEIDQTTGTARLKATFSNAHNTLWPGQFVNARVLVRTAHDVLTLPTAAVQLGPNGPFTYVVKADSTVEVRPLKIGEESGGMTVVNTGLAPERARGDQQPIPAAAGRARARQRHQRLQRPGAKRSPNLHEHFRALRPAADRHLAADGRHFSGRPGGLSSAAGGAAAAGRLPDDSGHGAAARRQSRRPWPPRWRRRWNINSRKSPACRR